MDHEPIYKSQLDRIERAIDNQAKETSDLKHQVQDWRLQIEIRLDRLEQSQANMTWLFRAAVVAAFSALAIGLVNLAPRVLSAQPPPPSHSDQGSSRKDVNSNR